MQRNLGYSGRLQGGVVDLSGYLIGSGRHGSSGW